MAISLVPVPGQAGARGSPGQLSRHAGLLSDDRHKERPVGKDQDLRAKRRVLTAHRSPLPERASKVRAGSR